MGEFTSASQFDTWITNHNVSSGKPTDIMVGDTFTVIIGETTYTVYIAGITSEYKKGPNSTPSVPHLTCISNVGQSKMNSTDTTTGGYNGATVMQTFLTTKAEELSTIFGSHLLDRDVLLSSAVTNGKASAWTWYTKKLTLMSEQQVYGSIQWGAPYDTGEAFEKLPIFNNLSPMQLFPRISFWLRSVMSTVEFARVANYGYPSTNGASATYAAVAVFCLG